MSLTDNLTAPDMSYEELLSFAIGNTHEYRGFHIIPKRDFGSIGYWSATHRCNVNAGWIISKSPEKRALNAMPGATWASTLEKARAMIDDFIEADGDADRFWELHRKRNSESASTDRALDAPPATILADHQGIQYDLAACCAEITRWRSTGLYDGTALKGLADRLPTTDSEDAIRRAELIVTREALRYLGSNQAQN